MGGDLPEWKVRVVDYIGLGMLLVCTEELWHRPKVWYSWGGALALGVAFLWAGEAVPIAWKWLHAKWRREQASTDAISIPPVSSEIVKPQHNVQFVGFKQLDEDYFRAATLVFRNVPNGKLLRKFLAPRLKVTYYDHATGLEIDDFYSVGWWVEEEIVEDISVAGRSAVLAIFTDKWRVGGQDNTLTSRVVEDESTPWDGRRSIELPFGEIRIVAVLFGNYVSSQAVTVTGVLTLGVDGTVTCPLFLTHS